MDRSIRVLFWLAIAGLIIITMTSVANLSNEVKWLASWADVGALDPESHQNLVNWLAATLATTLFAVSAYVTARVARSQIKVLIAAFVAGFTILVSQAYMLQINPFLYLGGLWLMTAGSWRVIYDNTKPSPPLSNWS